MLGILCKKQIRVPLSIPLAVCTGDFYSQQGIWQRQQERRQYVSKRNKLLWSCQLPSSHLTFPWLCIFWVSENIYGSPNRSLLWTPYFKTSIWHRSVTPLVIVSPPLHSYSAHWFYWTQTRRFLYANSENCTVGFIIFKMYAKTRQWDNRVNIQIALLSVFLRVCALYSAVISLNAREA